MPKPICVPCQRFFRPKKNGCYFIEAMPIGTADGHRVLPGKAEPENWKPYKLWCGDLHECQGCGAQIVVGHANSPISEHYMAGFEDEVKARKVTLTVNDC